MSLTRTQFQMLVSQILKKINACEGLIDYLENNHCFFYLSSKSKGHIDYQVNPNLIISLDRLEDDGGLIPSDNYSSFIDELLNDINKLFQAVKIERQAYLGYLEKIDSL